MAVRSVSAILLLALTVVACCPACPPCAGQDWRVSPYKVENRSAVTVAPMPTAEGYHIQPQPYTVVPTPQRIPGYIAPSPYSTF